MSVSRSNGSHAEDAHWSNDDERVVSVSYRSKAVLNGMQGLGDKEHACEAVRKRPLAWMETDDIMKVTEVQQKGGWKQTV